MFDGIFGGMFDIDGDGKLDVFEQALEFQAFSMLMDYSKKKKESESMKYESFSEDDFDVDILADMDEDEREEFLEAAGFDQSAFDF